MSLISSGFCPSLALGSVVVATVILWQLSNCLGWVTRPSLAFSSNDPGIKLGNQNSCSEQVASAWLRTVTLFTTRFFGSIKTDSGMAAGFWSRGYLLIQKPFSSMKGMWREIPGWGNAYSADWFQFILPYPNDHTEYSPGTTLHGLCTISGSSHNSLLLILVAYRPHQNKDWWWW